MSNSSGTSQNPNSYLTDEVLQEVTEYEERQRSQHRRYDDSQEENGHGVQQHPSRRHHEEEPDERYYQQQQQRSHHSRQFSDGEQQHRQRSQHDRRYEEEEEHMRQQRISSHSRRHEQQEDEYNHGDSNLASPRTRAQHDPYHHSRILPHSHNGKHGSDAYYTPTNARAEYAMASHQLLLEDTSSSSQTQKLCWRSDPSKSLSDWTLQVFNRTTKSFDVYNVHRVVLALGPRGCEYFQDVFRQAEADDSAAISKNKITRVPLIAESCQLVGTFLDYVYGNDQFEITNENALGICYLADYFRNHSLWDAATDFIEDDLSTPSGREHLCQYYTDSVYYDQDEFLDHILAVCALNLLPMMEEGISCTKLIEELTPHHFLQILGEMGDVPTVEENLSSAIGLTRLITEYCVVHKNELSMATFDHCTSRLTVLNSSSAITLLEASLDYDFGSYKPNRSIDSDNPNDRSDDSISSLILFQQQCIGTLSEEWEEILEIDQTRVTRIMRILALREEHQSILVDWFQKTLIRASHQLLASRKETEKSQQTILHLEDRCKAMAKDLELAQAATAKSQKNHNTTKSEMKTQISSWMRKNEGTNQQRQTEQQEWEHERLRWEIERQEWQHQKSRLKRELRVLRHQLAAGAIVHREYPYTSDDQHSQFSSSNHIDRHHRMSADKQGTTVHQQDRPFLIPDDYNGADDSGSYVTDSSSENNSLVDAPVQDFGSTGRSPHRYAQNNGMSPQFRSL